MPSHEDLKEVQEFRTSELKKYFKMGDHVRVLAGIHEGKTGLIIRVEENRVIVICEFNFDELEVLPDDLQLTIEKATGLDSLGGFHFGDFINSNNNLVGVIVRLEKDRFHVLDINGNVVECASLHLSTKPQSRYAAALDANRNRLEKKDIVKVLEGPQFGKTVEIKYIYRNNAFVYCRNSLENGGFLVYKTHHLELLGGQKAAENVAMPTTDNLSAGFMSHSISSPKPPTRRRYDFGGGRGRGGRGGEVRRNSNIGKHMKVIRGAYKGHMGQIIDEKYDIVQLHLDMDNLPNKWFQKDHLADNTHGPVKREPFRSCTPFNASGSQTPQYMPDGNKTPMYASGARTPCKGHTPNPYQGAQTPTQSSAWDPNIPNTPSRTSYPCETLSVVEDSPASPDNYSNTTRPTSSTATEKPQTNQPCIRFNTNHQASSSQTTSQVIH